MSVLGLSNFTQALRVLSLQDLDQLQQEIKITVEAKSGTERIDGSQLIATVDAKQTYFLKEVSELKLRDFIQPLGAFSLQDLDQLQQEIKIAVKAKSVIERVYGSQLIATVGAKQFYLLKEVSPESLGLGRACTYLINEIKPSQLPENHQAVRGTFRDNTPFIAINIELLDSAKKVINVVTELIFKQPSQTNFSSKSGELHENNYITAFSNTADKGQVYASCLCLVGKSMSQAQIEAVRDLLAGQTIPAPRNPTAINPLYIQMKKV